MNIQQICIWIVIITVAFLCGSIMFSRIIPKLFKNVDICKLSPDENPGAANVFTYCGIKLGMLCLIMDMLKGFLPVYTAYRIFGCESLLFSAVIIAPVLGHAIALFDKSKGGKCIATAFGVLLALLPVTRIVILLAALYIFFSTVIKISPNRKRSIVTFTAFGLISSAILAFNGKSSIAIACFVLSVIAIFKHCKFSEQLSVQEAAQY